MFIYWICNFLYQKIHCFKEGQPCEAWSEQLQSQLSVLDEPNLPNPFQDITDSDIEEATEESNMVDQDDDEDIVIYPKRRDIFNFWTF